MPYNGSGTYNPIPSPDFPAVAGTTIRSSQYNAQINDMATALSKAVTRDGQSPLTGDLPFNGQKALNVSNATKRDQFASAAQVQDGSLLWLPNVAGINDITADAVLDLTALAVGQKVVFMAAADNTGNVTLQIGALPARPVTLDGVLQLPAATLKTGVVYEAWYNGSNFQLGGLGAMVQSLQDDLAELALNAAWLGTPVGGYITSYSAPPKDNTQFRYALCTAGQDGPGGYNEGILTGETITGSAPLVIATATVSLAGSPFNGLTIHHINTEGRFIGAGGSEAFEDDALQNITGNFALLWGVGSGPSGSGALYKSSSQSGTLTGGGAANYNVGIGFDASRQVRTSDHTQPRTHRLPYYRRIL